MSWHQARDSRQGPRLISSLRVSTRIETLTAILSIHESFVFGPYYVTFTSDDSPPPTKTSEDAFVPPNVSVSAGGAACGFGHRGHRALCARSDQPVQPVEPAAGVQPWVHHPGSVGVPDLATAGRRERHAAHRIVVGCAAHRSGPRPAIRGRVLDHAYARTLCIP